MSIRFFKSLLCVFCLLLVLQSPAAALEPEYGSGAAAVPGSANTTPGFTDLDARHWAYETAVWAVDRGIALGYEDGSFRPQAPVTEEQFLALLVRAFGDVQEQEADRLWSDKYYRLADENRYPLSGSRQNSFTRKEAAELISATQGVNYSGKLAIQYLLDRGWVQGKYGATIEGFRGRDVITRAEALQLVRNLTEAPGFSGFQPRPEAPSDASALQLPPLAVERLYTAGDAEQVLMATASDYNDIHVKVSAFEKVNGVWTEVLTGKEGVVGVLGFAEQMAEGKSASPQGMFPLQAAFGKYANPGTRLPYRQATANDFWVDDSASALYNTWQKGPANGRWSSAEQLLRKDNLYDYAVEIGYNEERIPGKGSAIFLHIKPASGKGTGGCTALAKDDLLAVMKWLDPAKHPVIVQGTAAFIDEL